MTTAGEEAGFSIPGMAVELPTTIVIKDNPRELWQTPPGEECYCCTHGHPDSKTFYAGWDESDICYDCNFFICRRVRSQHE